MYASWTFWANAMLNYAFPPYIILHPKKSVFMSIIAAFA